MRWDATCDSFGCSAGTQTNHSIDTWPVISRGLVRLQRIPPALTRPDRRVQAWAQARAGTRAERALLADATGLPRHFAASRFSRRTLPASRHVPSTRAYVDARGGFIAANPMYYPTLGSAGLISPGALPAPALEQVITRP